jgi:hypothetical protein
LPCHLAGKRDAGLVCATIFGWWLEVFMEERASVYSSDRDQTISQQSISQQSVSGSHREGRGAWVLTAYGVSGLALVGVLAYFFSDFIAH